MEKNPDNFKVNRNQPTWLKKLDDIIDKPLEEVGSKEDKALTMSLIMAFYLFVAAKIASDTALNMGKEYASNPYQTSVEQSIDEQQELTSQETMNHIISKLKLKTIKPGENDTLLSIAEKIAESKEDAPSIADIIGWLNNFKKGFNEKVEDELLIVPITDEGSGKTSLEAVGFDDAVYGVLKSITSLENPFRKRYEVRFRTTLEGENLYRLAFNLWSNYGGNFKKDGTFKSFEEYLEEIESINAPGYKKNGSFGHGEVFSYIIPLKK